MCDGESDFEAITNADKIRSMSDEELAEFLEKFEVCSYCEYMDKEICTLDNPCVHGFAVAMTLKWLQSEAE
jgi:translation initiation factor 2 beta subunit (eIF-2beta)/eIF-5